MFVCRSIIVSNTSVEDGEAGADSGVPKDRSAIYATAPRSKVSQAVAISSAHIWKSKNNCNKKIK